MPIYTFRCSQCDHKFTDFFSMSQSAGKGVVCPKCKSKKIKRVYQDSFSMGKKSVASCPTGTCPFVKS